MELEKRLLRENTAEEYRVLLRAEAELLLPREYPRIRSFYLTLAEKCIAWATEVTGTELRRRYNDLPNNTERARFRTRAYRFHMRYPSVDGRCAVIICESERSGEGERIERRRISHVWYLPEETLLPYSQILKRYSCGMRIHGVGFRPDGVYPENGELVFFKNVTEKGEILEKRYTPDADGNL